MAESNLIRTRYFGMMVDPRQYGGLRGRWLNLLNFVRVLIEKRVALHILKLECKKANINNEEMKSVIRQANSDPLFVPKMEQQKQSRRGLLRSRFSELFEKRYKGGRLNSDYLPDRPAPIQEGMGATLAEYEKRRNRSLRYFSGRGMQVITELEEKDWVKNEQS